VVRILGFLVALFALATSAVARPAVQARPFIPTGAAADMPVGYAELCRSEPIICHRLAGAIAPATGAIARDPAGLLATPGSVDSERDWLRLLRRVDGSVNAHVRQQSDRAIYGTGELWRASGSGRNAVGDCEDLAIEKRLQLIEAGFPSERLFFAVVYGTGIGLHTILVARLTSGDWVLDSRTPFVERWSETPYQWLTVERPGAPTKWDTVDVG
jgi:predicted transglutaminase-like cysteine proteinase